MWLLLAALTGYGIFALGLLRRGPSAPRHRVWIMLPLILLAFLGHLRLVVRDSNTNRLVLYPPPIQFLEFYHYYVGTKYFPELGYDGIYEATVVADHQDAPGRFRRRAQIRDLRDNRSFVRRAKVLADSDRIVARFSPERWQAFKRDIALFRAALPGYWESSAPQRDHGYNGTPLTTAVLGTLANLGSLPADSFMRAARWFDLGLVVLGAVALAALLDSGAALVFAFFWFANPLNDWGFVGSAYLRYNYLFALVFGIALLERGRLAASGFCFALSAIVGLFPAFIVLGIGLHQLLRGDRWSVLREHRNLYLSFVGSSLALVGLGSLVPSPEGENSWVAFTERMRVHAPSLALNRVGLRVPFHYAARHGAAGAEAAARHADERDWKDETDRTFARRRPYFVAATIAAAAALLFAAPGLRRAEGALLGMGIVFIALMLAHYYYAMLLILPLVFRRDRGVLALITAAFALLVLSRWATIDHTDLSFSVLSVEVGALLIGLPLLLRLRGPARMRDPQAS